MAFELTAEDGVPELAMARDIQRLQAWRIAARETGMLTDMDEEAIEETIAHNSGPDVARWIKDLQKMLGVEL